MGLDGLRAWIGEVERKLGIRTKVMLALAVIAIAIAGAGIYLSIDTRESSVSESDVQALQQELEARIDSASGGGSEAATLKTEVQALRTQVEELESSKSQGKSGSGGSNGEKEKAPESAKP
jgi:type II secretory pathway pseudopilin PulG